MSGPDSGGKLWVRARQLLASYRGNRVLSGEEWLELAREAHEFAVSTFPEKRREGALRGFVERNCVGQAPRTIAVFAVALRLLGERRLREGFGQFGACLEAAALACSTTVDELPPPRDSHVVTEPAATVAAAQARAKQEQVINRRMRGSGVDSLI